MRIDCLIPCARREFVQLRVLLWGAVASLAFAAVWLLKRCLRSPLVVCHASVSEECETNGKGHAFRTCLRWRVGDTRHHVTCLSPGLSRRARDGSLEILYCEAYDTVLIPGRKTRIRT